MTTNNKKTTQLDLTLIKIVHIYTSKVVLQLSPYGVDEYEDILQRMLIRAVINQDKYRSNPSGGVSVSFTTFLHKQLGYYANVLLREYMTNKRKVYLHQEQLDYDNGYLFGTNLDESLLIGECMDVRQIVARLKGDKQILAHAYLKHDVEDLGWSAKKISRIKTQLVREFRKYGYFGN